MSWVDWVTAYSAAAGTVALVLAIADYRALSRRIETAREIDSDLCSQCKRIAEVYRDELHSRN